MKHQQAARVSFEEQKQQPSSWSYYSKEEHYENVKSLKEEWREKNSKKLYIFYAFLKKEELYMIDGTLGKNQLEFWVKYPMILHGKDPYIGFFLQNAHKKKQHKYIEQTKKHFVGQRYRFYVYEMPDDKWRKNLTGNKAHHKQLQSL